jgi:ankyrin repeat protein
MPKSHRPSAPTSSADALGRTELHKAEIDGNAARCRQLLAESASPGAVDVNGWAPLHFAAQSRGLEVVDALIVAGATVDIIDNHGNSALWRAVFSSQGDGRVIERLRAAGADPYLANSGGVSPVGLARKIGNYDVAQFFRDLPVEA